MNQIRHPQPVRQKPRAVNDRRYLDSFKDSACESCGTNDGTVVGAHCNWGQFGKRWGVVAGLCFTCHNLADGRTNAPLKERYMVWIRVLQNILRKRAEAFLSVNDGGNGDG